MAADISEALAVCLLGQADVPDAMFGLLTGLAVEDGNAAASERLLRTKRLPLGLAEDLVARRGVTAAEVAAFAAREDMPAETLQAWVRKERRVTVLAVIAAKPGLPLGVYEALAAREGVALRNALLANESAPVTVRAGIAADLFVSRLSSRDRWSLESVLAGSEPLQRTVFDRLKLSSLNDCLTVSGWPGLDTWQLHSLLGRVEALVVDRLAALEKDLPSDQRNRLAGRARFDWREAGRSTVVLAEHPSADAALLDRLETFVDSYDLPLMHPGLAEAVASARLRLAALGDDSASVASAPYEQLVELAGSGVLCTKRLVGLAVSNPLFDTDVAVKVLEAVPRHKRTLTRTVSELLAERAPDLVSAVRVHRAAAAHPSVRTLDSHIREASTGTLLEALDSVADSSEWTRTLTFRFAAVAAGDAVTDDVVGRFGWFPDHMAGTTVAGRRLGVLTADYLHRRFGDHVPAWRVFANIADPSTPLAEAAALAVHAEPPPDIG